MRIPSFDESALREALGLAEEVYRRHEAGQPYSEELQKLSIVTGQEIEVADVHGAFGSMAADDWARDLLLLSQPLPQDLSREELIEMIGRICSVEDPEWLQHWYIRCLEATTGCPDVIDIIYHPRNYFGDEDHDEMPPTEVLEIAMAAKRRVLTTPISSGQA